MKREIKQIEHPSANQLSIILIPTIFLGGYALIVPTPKFWMFWAAGSIAGIYLILLTYFCLRQKCYKQLWIAWAKVGIFALCFILIDAVPHLFK